jgi:hypothetical protein
MSTRVDLEEIHTTRSEKLLAVVLTGFLLMGGLWVYSEPLDRTEGVSDVGVPPPPSPAQRTALDVGPLVLSLAGIGLTVAAFVALQRYLATRIPQRRVRRGECPFCGYSVRGGAHCEGCGRQVVGRCPSCSGSRRVGAPHCGVCGAT